MAALGQNEGKAPVTTAKALEKEFLPRHVAIIMDGNGRWAQKRGMPRTFGHKAGVEALREIIKYSDELGVEALTVYAFSAENWKRSTEEVGALMRLLLQYFTSEIDELNEKNVRIRILGDIDGMPRGLEKQKDALVRQAAEAEEAIRARGWRLVDAYVESRSGTSRKGRREYNRLYEDLEQNRFDVVVIKSQDRLMRNTRDWYLFADRLNCAGKRLYFYLENTFYSPEDALLTGIKAILAEEYSRELSKKMNLAHQKRQQNNGKPVLTSKSYGYRRTADGAIEIIPEAVSYTHLTLPTT